MSSMQGDDICVDGRSKRLKIIASLKEMPLLFVQVEKAFLDLHIDLTKIRLSTLRYDVHRPLCLL